VVICPLCVFHAKIVEIGAMCAVRS
jgi:hypothetical protein